MIPSKTLEQWFSNLSNLCPYHTATYTCDSVSRDQYVRRSDRRKQHTALIFHPRPLPPQQQQTRAERH
ncbi:hypothetical protein E2C01_098827 [Portunus trituberculatus]|uniref:Uncharacterized protein n=1 Tax=Portunus trituberculatus TaxID=210409 RepID=A0A5B7JYR9_PORTR|nr:hypothetical protein [Portunus trituberculatus]